VILLLLIFNKNKNRIKSDATLRSIGITLWVLLYAFRALLENGLFMCSNITFVIGFHARMNNESYLPLLIGNTLFYATNYKNEMFSKRCPW